MAISKISGSGIGAINAPVEFTSADNLTQLTITSTDADANAGPRLVLKRDSGSPADGDIGGVVEFTSDNDAGEATDFARIRVHLDDVSNGTEDGNLKFFTLVAGSEVSRMGLASSETVFNEDSVDVDFRVESNGNANMLFVDGGNDAVVIGHNDATNGTFASSQALQVVGTSFTTSSLGLTRFSADANGPSISLSKSRAAGIGTDTVVQDDDSLGNILFTGADGTDMATQGATISAAIDGTPGGNDLPTRLTFATTGDGNSSPTERMRIANAGHVGIGETAPSTDLVVKQSGSTFTTADQTVALFQRNTATGSGCKVTILSGNNTAGDLNFGDAQDEDVGKISYNHSTDSMHFTTNAIERVSISSNGTQEHKATSTATITTGTGILNIIAQTARSSGNGPFIGFRVPNSTGGTTHEDMGALGFISPDSTDGNRIADFVILARSGSFSEKFRIAGNGTITATDTSIGSNSDSRLKKDITDYTYDWAKFKNYSVKKFNWKHPELHMGKTNQIGFLAQDLQGVDSQWVSEVPLQPKDENEDAHIEAQYLDADLVSLTSKLGEKDAMYVSIIQQLIAKVETLESKVKTLEDA